MKLFITFTSAVLLGMQSANAAVHGGGGVLPDDMKELLHDKFDAGACEALRGQRCVVGDERFECAQLPFIHSRCSGVHHSRTADGKHGLYCVQSEMKDDEDNEFVDATHGTTDCAVLSAGDACVDDTATVGLKCKDGMTCEGFTKSTVAGTPDTLGTCKGTAATRNAEPAASEPAAPPAPTPAASPSSPATTEAPSSGTKAGLFALHISVAVGVLHYFLL